MNVTTNSTIDANSTLTHNATMNVTTLAPMYVNVFDEALKRYPIEVSAISAAFLGIYIILAALLTIIAIGHRAYLVLLCYRVVPKSINKNKAKRQFWLHTLYCFMVFYSVFKVFNFVAIIYRAATLQLSGPDMSFIQVDIFLSDIAIIIVVQIFLVVLNSVAFTTAQKACIVIVRIILVLCVINGLVYIVILTLNYTLAAVVGLYASYSAIPLVAGNKIVLTIITVIIGVCMHRLVGSKNKKARSLTRRLFIMVFLMVVSTIVIFACTGASFLVDQTIIVYMALIAMGVPTITVFMVVIIIFWPKRFSCSILKKQTLGGGGLNIDTSENESSTVTATTPRNLTSDNNHFVTDPECVTPIVTDVKYDLSRQNIDPESPANNYELVSEGTPTSAIGPTETV
ncbi:D-aminoacyl-tRNA deacylase [Acrasis kona]|uniref:D-aminoacyl-tRNA deacylase n=1 Tax=Acrasis kona TaxID=1008807 RepID=A0AAW2YYY2_9EUKA